jgi:hypothetical protein
MGNVGLKRSRREADHSPSSSAEVKKGGAIPPLLICLYSIVLNYEVKYRDEFIFLIQYFNLERFGFLKYKVSF